MTEQVWNFANIAGNAGEIQGAVQATESLLKEGQGSLATLAGVWGGTGSEAYMGVQKRWDDAAHELNTALADLAIKIRDAGESMAHTEQAVTGMFA